MLNPHDLTFYPNLTDGALWTGLPVGDPSEPRGVAADTSPVNDQRRAWLWSPSQLISCEGTTENINRLTAAGWERLPGRTMDQMDMSIYHIWTQLRDIRGVQIRRVLKPGLMPNDDKELWARTVDIQAARRYPVALAFTITPYLMEKSALAQFAKQRAQGGPLHAWIPEVLPPPTLGTRGLVYTRDDREQDEVWGWQDYKLDALPQEAHELQERLANALRELAAPHGWYVVGESTHKALQAIAEPAGYARHRQVLQSGVLATSGHMREIAQELLQDFDASKARYEQMHQSRSKYPADIWLERWGEIQRMAEDLAAAYWRAHTNLQRSTEHRDTILPALTSSHRTLVPSANAFRALMQSFGPGLQQSVWNMDTSAKKLELHVPNGSTLQLEAESDNANAILHRYVGELLGPEGLKHLIGVLDSYDVQTGGEDQKVDARVSLSQLLLRMGYPEQKAYDASEQKKVMHTIYYLNHCYINAPVKEWRDEGRGRGRKVKDRRWYTPLLIIEGIQFEEDGNLRIPTEVKYHLGEEYYELLYGEHPQYFIVPTAQLLGYHSQKQQQELVLGFNLSNFINMNDGRYTVSFRTLMEQSALRSAETLDHGSDRTRDARRALLALERLERDGFHERAAHPEIDTVLAIELATGECVADDLAPATLARLQASSYYSGLRNADKAVLREKRRKAIQHLLGAGKESPIITFTAGPLLRAQAEKRAAQRKAAQERNENALAARVTRRVVDAIQNTETPEKKPRGRPRKRPEAREK